jgi:hypothetical protein
MIVHQVKVFCKLIFYLNSKLVTTEYILFAKRQVRSEKAEICLAYACLADIPSAKKHTLILQLYM